MPTWLIILIAIVCCIAIVAFVYMILAFRKIIIVSKKTDYLVEDLTYKSERLNDTISTIAKISNYLEATENLVKNNAETLDAILNGKNKKNTKNKSEKLDNEEIK